MQNIKVYMMIFFLIGGLSMPTANAQEEEFTTTIKTRGRYVEGKGIELRFFPDKPAILNTGLQSGFVIERAIGETGDFAEIARVQPFSDAEWEAAITAAEPGSETQDYLDLAWNFLQSATTPAGGSFNFQEGISSMRQQKAEEDFEYAVFVLSAIREAQVAEALGLSYLDADVEAGISYVYRVSIVESHPLYSVVSEPFVIEASKNENEFSNEIYVYEGDTELNFAWEETARLSGYYVERMGPGEDSFSLLNDAPLYNLSGKLNDQEGRGGYRDENLENYERYIYRFYANNIFGERVLVDEIEAMPRDRTPPGQPYLQKPEHVAPREVEVLWEMNDVPAEDLMGFAVGRSATPEGNFSVLNGSLLNKESRSFIDTSFVEGARNYYVVQAIDTAFNVSSSLPVSVMLIDTIPPVQPVFESGIIDSTGVVTLSISKNTERDLMGYRIFRANDPEHEFSVVDESFVEIDTLNQEIQVVFNDTVTLNSLTPYIYYRTKALDFNYNQSSFSDIMKIERPDTIPPTTPVFKRVINRANEIELHFALSQSKDVEAHQLYRKENMEEPWEVYAALETTQQIFVDSLARQGVIYYYSLRARDNSELYSDFAKAVYGKAYDDGVRPVVDDLSLEMQEGTVTLSWNYEQMDENTFFVIYKTDQQGRLISHGRSDSLEFSETINPDEVAGYAVRTYTADGGQSRLSDQVVYEP